MTVDDALYRLRLRAFALAQELGNVRAACRAMGIHPSMYYRWRRQVLRFGPEILCPRELILRRSASSRDSNTFSVSISISRYPYGGRIGAPGQAIVAASTKSHSCHSCQ